MRFLPRVFFFMIGAAFFAIDAGSTVAQSRANVGQATATPASMRERAWAALEGRGGPPNPTAAFEWFGRGAASGDPIAKNNLGWMRQLGLGAPQSNQEAYRLYREAAEAGHVPAMYNVAALLVNWAPVTGSLERRLRGPTDVPENEKWYWLFETRQIYRNPLVRGWPRPPFVVERDQEAVHWLERATAEGHVPSMVLLGLMNKALRAGPESAAIDHARRRLEPSPEADAPRATFVRFMEQAAAGGSAEALWWLSVAYREGSGVPRDGARADSLLYRAALAGFPEAMVSLGQSNDTVAVALAWFERAAGLGDPDAMALAATCYLDPCGTYNFAGPRWVGRDTARARALAQRALEGGSLRAPLLFARLEKIDDYRNGRALLPYWHYMLMNTTEPVHAQEILDAIRGIEATEINRREQARLRNPIGAAFRDFTTLLLAAVALAALAPGDEVGQPGLIDPGLIPPPAAPARRSCGYVTRSFQTVHGGRALFGGPGTMWTCN